MAKRNDGRTRSGRFQKGVSGNPTGGATKKPGESVTVRKDEWQNFFTGMGIFGRDKRMGANFAAHSLSFDQLKDLWLCDDLAARSVETIPREAMRQGYDVMIASSQDDDEPEDLGYMGYANPELTTPDEPEQDDSLDHAELASEVTQKLDDLGADEYLEIVGSYERGYGGGALLIGANDGQEDMTKPLSLDRVRSLDWLTPLEARELLPLYAYGDPRAPKYGQPEIYQLQSRSTLPSYGGGTFSTTMMIHETRLIIFPGIRVSRYQAMTARGGWGESALNRVYRVLRDFNTAWQAAGVLVTDFAQSVIKIAGLWEALALDGEKAFQNRLAAMEYGRSVVNAVTIDAGDSYERQQTPLSGLPDLLEKFAVRLAAACDMPLTLLFGTSPAGMNATGESDVRFFYDRVASYQKRKMEPALRRLCQIIFRTLGSKVEPDKWAIKFRPLWQDSAKDKAAAMLTQAQADTAWITAGVLSSEEVAAAHWGKGEYDPNLTVDFDARASLEHAVDPPVTVADKNATQIDPNTGLPMDIDPATGLPVNNAPQIDPETGEPIPPDEQQPQVDPKTGQPVPQVDPKTGKPAAQDQPTAPQQIAPQGPPGQRPPVRPGQQVAPQGPGQQVPPGQRPVPGQQPQLRVVPGKPGVPGQAPPKHKVPPDFTKPRPNIAAEDSADRLRRDVDRVDNDWDESKHPRDGGKFASSEGSSGDKSTAQKIAEGKAAIANAPKSHDARISKGNKPTRRTPEVQSEQSEVAKGARANALGAKAHAATLTAERVKTPAAHDKAAKAHQAAAASFAKAGPEYQELAKHHEARAAEHAKVASKDDHRPQAEKDVPEQAKHEGKQGGEHAGDEPTDKGHSAEGSGHSTEKAAGEKNAKSGHGEKKGKGEKGKGKEKPEENKFGEKLSEFAKGGTELVAGEDATKLAEQLGPVGGEGGEHEHHGAEHEGGDESEDDEHEKE